MLQLKNSEHHFGLVAILFHWLIALLIIGLLAVGLYMTSLPTTSPLKYTIYDVHKEFGILVFVLVTLRALWRFVNVTPKLDIPWIQLVAARLSHYGLYVLMFAMPLSGWLMSSASGYLPSIFGLFNLPGLISPNQESSKLFEEAHQWIGYGLIALICIHLLAALKHHFIDKDDVLKRIIS